MINNTKIKNVADKQRLSVAWWDMLDKMSVICRLGLNDFKARYAGSVLGILWAVAEPLVTVLVYRFVYTVALGFDSFAECPYYLRLSVGLAAWLFASDGIKSMTACFRDYSFLVTKTGFARKSILKFRVFSALISHIIFLGLVLIISAAEGRIGLHALLLPIYVAANMLFVYLCGGICAIFCAKYKDVQNIVGVLLNILFWVTPIFWDSLSIAEDFVVLWINLNPIAAIVNGYKGVILYNSFDVIGFVYITVVNVVLLILFKLTAKRYLSDIADNL